MRTRTVRLAAAALAAAMTLAVLVALAKAAPPAPEPPQKPVVSAGFDARADSVDLAVTKNKGKVVLANFWATWCPPCVKKFPEVVALHKAYKDKGLAVATVSFDKGRPGYKADKVLMFLADHEADCINYILGHAATDMPALAKRFGLGGTIPYMTLFDKTGKRVWDSNTPLAPEKLKALIEAELAK